MAAIIGPSAVSLDGQAVAEVSDVITDESQTVAGYLVAAGGFLDLGEKHVFIPKDQAIVRIDGISVELVIQLTAAGFNTDLRVD